MTDPTALASSSVMLNGDFGAAARNAASLIDLSWTSNFFESSPANALATVSSVELRFGVITAKR
jgi:hypothetical protein